MLSNMFVKWFRCLKKYVVKFLKYFIFFTVNTAHNLKSFVIESGNSNLYKTNQNEINQSDENELIYPKR